MSQRAVAAAIKMRDGYNCAQSVLFAFAEDMGLSKKDALRVAGAFGGGMARMGNVCGAVSGALMAIGLAYSKTATGEDAARDKGYELSQAFREKFVQKHGSIQCRELIKFDLCNPAERAEANASGVFDTKCVTFVEDAADIVEELLVRGV